MEQKIRVGIVGVTPNRSWAARAHIPALKALPQYEITGVSSSTEASARVAANAFAIPNAFSSVSALVSSSDVDLVAVTVKVPHHAEIVYAAFDAGKMVYCEWPLGNGIVEARDIAARARTLGLRTAVGLQARSSPTEGDIQITADLGHAQLTDLKLRSARLGEIKLSEMEIPPSYRTVPSEIVGAPLNVAESYARFAQGASVPDPTPDFDQAVRLHELLNAIERSSVSGMRIQL